MRKKLLSIVALAVTLLVVIGVSGCSKKEANTSNLPTAKSLIDAGFNKGLTNGHFSGSINSTQMKQNSDIKGFFKGDSLVNLDYSITTKGKTQNESIWLTPDTAYFLLKANKGHWIKNSANADNFDANQVTKRFNPSSFKSLNSSIEKVALMKQNSNTYTVKYNGTDQNVWKHLNDFVVDTLNTPGTQNMQIVRMVNASQPKNINITYTFNMANKKLTKVNMSADFSVNGQYDFTWKLNYSELGQHNNLSIPSDIQKNAVDVQNQDK